MKPHKRNGRDAKVRRQEAAKDRQDRSRELLKNLFGKKESNEQANAEAKR